MAGSRQIKTVKGFCDSDPSTITLEVGAKDAGDPVLTAPNNAKVAVTIKQGNVESPKFDKTSYQRTILESTSKGTTIVTVSAKDSDCGDQENLQYTIKSGNTSPAFFAINSRSVPHTLT